MTDGSSPARAPASPVNVGLVFFVKAATELIVTAGGTVTTVNVTAELLPTSPTLSSWVACAVYVPWASALAGVNDHVEPLGVTTSDAATVPPTELPS